MNFITLLTDFGLNNAYVAQMKGVICTLAPHVRCVDITHMVPPQNVQIGAFLLSTTANYFPKGTIHVGVVDPGVGTERKGIVVVTPYHVFVGPDNGLFMNAVKNQGVFDVYEITNESLCNTKISPTFHGRDIFAPIAAHIANGISFQSIGRKISDYVTLSYSKPIVSDTFIEAEAVFIDDFGNIITNLDVITFHKLMKSSSSCKIKIQDNVMNAPYVSSYGYTQDGQLLVTMGSTDLIEIAVNKGNASSELSVVVGDKILFDFS